MLTTAEKEARTVALLQRVQTVGGMAMLIPEPSNRHNRNAVLARHMGVSVGYVSDDYLAVVHKALRQNGGRPLLAPVTEVKVYGHGYLYVALPDADAAPAEPVLYEVDWSRWMADVPLLPTSEAEYCQTEAEMMLEMTPFCQEALAQLTFNVDLWLRGSENDLSREAREGRSRYIELLDASPDTEAIPEDLRIGKLYAAWVGLKEAGILDEDFQLAKETPNTAANYLVTCFCAGEENNRWKIFEDFWGN